MSPVTHSRRSESWGRLSGRFSKERLSWDNARTGMFSSFASALRLREISLICCSRESTRSLPFISCK